MELADRSPIVGMKRNSGEDSGETRRKMRRGRPLRGPRVFRENRPISATCIASDLVGARGFEPPTPRPPAQRCW